MNKAVATSVMLTSLAVFAADPADPKVPVQLEVVRASTKVGEVPESLKKMQEALASRVKYGTLQVVDSKQLELTTKAAEKVDLPNKSQAEFKLERLKSGVATVKVNVPPTQATYTLAKGRALYFQAGAFDNGDLWLVLSEPK